MFSHLPASEARPEFSGRGKWYIVALLWGAFVLNYVDRQVVFSIFPLLRRELHFSSAALGSIGAIFTWVYCLCMPVAGRVADMMRRDRLIITSLVLWSVATYGTGTAASLSAILFWRAMMAVSESLFVPAALGMVAAIHTGPTRSRALSVFATGQFAGIVAGGAFGGWMGEHINWRLGFTVLAGAGIGYALILLAKMQRDSATCNTEIEPKSNWLHVFGSRTWLSLCCAFFFYCAMLWMLLAWLADFIHSRYGISLTASGVSATIFLQAGSAAGVLAGGFLGDSVAKRVPGGRFYVSAFGLFACAPFAWGLLATNSLTLLQVFSFAFGSLGGLFVANLYASAYDVISGANYGFSAGAMNLVGGLAGGFAIFLTGLLRAKFGIGWLAGWMSVGALLSAVVLVASTALFFPRDQARAFGHSIQSDGQFAPLQSRSYP